MRRIAGLAVVASALAVSAAATATPALVVRGDTHVAGLRVGNATLEQATIAFGSAGRRLGVTAHECNARWERYGVRLHFVDLNGRDSCGDGVLTGATVTGTTWRSDRGLRVGDSLQRLRAVYPRAAFHDAAFAGYRGWWLVPRRACLDVGGQTYPGLLARSAHGRVTALVVALAPCE